MDNGYEYLVNWKGESEVEWIREELFSSEDIIRAYWKLGKAVLLQGEVKPNQGNSAAPIRTLEGSKGIEPMAKLIKRFLVRGQAISIPGRYRD